MLHASILHSEEKMDANLPLGRKFLRFSKLKSKFFKNFNEKRIICTMGICDKVLKIGVATLY